MDVITEELGRLADRETVRDCVARLARGEDRRDAALIRACFWPEAAVDFGIFVDSFDAYLAWVVPGAPSIPVTLHTLGQSLVELHGSTALVETHVTAYHRIDVGGEERDVVIGGRYLDRMERRRQEWRIVHRTMLYDWTRNFGPAVDWSQGLMGMPFLGSHSVGSARGDHSERFFSRGEAGSAGG